MFHRWETVKRSALFLGVAFATSGCAVLQTSPLVEAQQNAMEERERIARATALDVRQQSSDDRIDEGDRFRAQGRSDQAMLSYLAAIRMDPAASKAKERIGFVQLASDLDRAEGIFERLVAEDALSASAWRGLGLARMAKANLSGAKAALDVALELEPDSAGAQYAMASVLGLMGRPLEALEHASKAEALRPNDPHVSNVVGMTNLLLDRYGEAETAFAKSVRMSPNTPSFANNLGLALGLQGRFDEARDAFRKAGDEQAALNNLGYVLFLGGHYKQAIDQYERALAEPGDADLLILKNLNAAISARAIAKSDREPGEG